MKITKNRDVVHVTEFDRAAALLRVQLCVHWPKKHQFVSVSLFWFTLCSWSAGKSCWSWKFQLENSNFLTGFDWNAAEVCQY